MKISPTLVAAVMLGLCEPIMSTAWSANIPSLASPAVLHVPSAAGSYNGALVLVIDGASKDLEDSKLVSSAKEFSPAAPPAPTVEFKDPVALPPGANQRRWVLPVTVKDMPSGVDQTRYVTVKIGATESTFPYQLTNPAAATTWKIFPLPKPSRAANSAALIGLNIAVEGDTPVQKLQLAPTEFVDKTTGWTLADGQLALCPEPAPCHGDGFPIPPKGKQVWITPRTLGADGGGGSPWLWPGQYEGVVALSSEGKSAAESTNVTVFVSMWYWQLLGVFLLVVGVSGAFYFSTVLRHSAERSKMMQAPVALRERISDIAARLSTLRAIQAPNVRDKLKQIASDLKDAALEAHGLPGRIPSPWKDITADVQTFQSYLQTQASSLESIASIVGEGLVVLEGIPEQHVASGSPLSDAENIALEAAIKEVDKLAKFAAPPVMAELVAKINVIVADFIATLSQKALQPVMLHFAKTRREVRTSKTLQIQIERENLQAWLFIATVTTLVGTYILVLGNRGFGTPMDLLGCLLWGLGFPAGTALAANTTSSVATALNVTH